MATLSDAIAWQSVLSYAYRMIDMGAKSPEHAARAKTELEKFTLGQLIQEAGLEENSVSNLEDAFVYGLAIAAWALQFKVGDTSSCRG